MLIFTPEMQRVAANLAQRHDAWVDALRRRSEQPASMFWKSQAGSSQYLAIKRRATDVGTTVGLRGPETEQTLREFEAERDAADFAIGQTSRALAEIIRQYRALRLPLAMPKPARILRELDIAGLLGRDFMVVGTNAFAVYEIEAGCRFPAGVCDETEDFDLAWCRGSGVSLSATSARPTGSPLLRILRSIDPSFTINRRRPYQARDASGYEVELLVAPSLFRTLSPEDVFSPMAIFTEQEWLLQGRAVQHVVVGRDNKTCPIFAPDPRWMALHKLWIARKPERDASKRPKDQRQGELLLSVIRDRMQVAYPLDIDFVLDLPQELRPIFDRWAAIEGFVPGQAGESMR